MPKTKGTSRPSARTKAAVEKKLTEVYKTAGRERYKKRITSQSERAILRRLEQVNDLFRKG